MTDKTGGPAFPHHFTPDSIGDCSGITIRDHFAGKAMSVVATGHMQGYTDNDGRLLWYLPSNTFSSVAADAYAMADAMIAAREE
jgi:hypothetical protein